MSVGMGCTLQVAPSEVKPSAVDLDAKRRVIAEGKHGSLTIWKLLDLIDHDHLDTVLTLHWLRILTNYVPELAFMKKEVSLLFRTHTAKLRLHVEQTQLHPLACNDKNETDTGDLKAGLLDFLEQVGYKADDYLPRMMRIGGDGLTFEKIHQLKRYLQFHLDPLKSFELINPSLDTGHSQWTDQTDVIKTHWGSQLSNDPSTIGHSATKISRKAPPNFKKIAFYAGADLMYLVTDCQVLDCWR